MIKSKNDDNDNNDNNSLGYSNNGTSESIELTIDEIEPISITCLSQVKMQEHTL